MSRIGKKPIPVPTGVNVTIEPEVVRVAGMRAGLRLQLLAGNRPQVGRIGRRMRVGSGSRVLVVAAVTVTGLAARTLRPAVGAVQRDAVQTRADQHGEQEAGQR